ncbi:hypothetical protein AQUCO_00600468v1 [Aquilegia coerulea]|uniref:CSC1/OSCA1-like 7TM region domain-containing protein n=1 Tax=Aquilegia coerulea TaxID=218851 RepID=A0A2G5EPW3_AQUCA|nr:hypothetical protein AQUCO_00600468v1 [Aquilegia coerulea]
MILSALLTSVGINLLLCILFFTLYSILRKQPSNIDVYAPRLVAEGKAHSSAFSLERLLPSPGWVRRAWQLSEDELLSAAGLDGVVFMRIFTFSLKIFSFMGLVGILILLPINYVGKQLNAFDISDLPNKSLDAFSISNLEDGSKRLWVHFVALYLATGVVCYFLYHEYRYISLKRLDLFYSSKPQPHQFTILVRSIPKSSEGTSSDSVESFFAEYYPSIYLSHTMVCRTSKLQGLITDAKKLYKKLTDLKSDAHAQHKSRRSGFLGLWGQKVTLVDHYGKKLEDLEENVRMEQSDVSLAREELPEAFVSFKTRYGASTALHIKQSDNPAEWVTEIAPEPSDVYWPFFYATFLPRWISKLIVIVATIILTLLFLIPVAFVQGLANASQLVKWLPFLKGILTIAFVSQVITGYLPSLILQWFLSIVPPIMKIFSSMQGYISNSEIEKSACTKVLWFTIWNVFFANVLTGSAFSTFQFFLDFKDIPQTLAIAVPGQASFYISYVVTSGWTSVSSELFRMSPLFWSTITSCARGSDNEVDVSSVPYTSVIPRILLFVLLGITYFFLAPLILPFVLAYFCLGYVVYRNQLINVYAPKYDTAGKFWPIVHNSTIFSLVLVQALAVGLFGLKQLPLASTLTFPLIVLTLLFNEYCRKRFLPIFQTYSAESLIKKDRKDSSDPAMTDFLDKLVTAYRDPALMPIHYSQNANDHNTPLLT